MTERSPTPLPAGTRVVVTGEVDDVDTGARFPAGAVAVITHAPLDPAYRYRLRFADGCEATLPRDRFVPQKKGLRDEIASEQPPAAPLDDFIIYECIVGSRAYGLDHFESDTDLRGIYLPPADLHWSLWGVPEQIERPESEECYWELGKFIALALKSNPNILECLYTPLVEHATPLARELLAIRSIFVSKLVYQTYNGYVLSQFRKIEQDLRTRGEPRWKHAMHLIRLLLSGIGALETGEIPIHVSGQRERLLAVRRGEVAWAELGEWKADLHRRFDSVYRSSRLPDRPDYDRANGFLLRARRSRV